MGKILPYELLNLEACWCSTQIITTIIKPTDMLRQVFGGCLLFMENHLPFGMLFLATLTGKEPQKAFMAIVHVASEFFLLFFTQRRTCMNSKM